MEGWLATTPYDFETTDIQAASRFRRFANESAERIFKRRLATRYETFSKQLPKFLDHHQLSGVRWILTRSRSYLAHAPGAGKTLQAILGAYFSLPMGKAVFVVPPSLNRNWQAEIHKWMSRLEAENYKMPLWYASTIVRGTSQKDDVDWSADFIIVPDSMLHKQWVLDKLLSLKIAFIAVDEASRFKESTSLRSIRAFGGKKAPSNRRVLYTMHATQFYLTAHQCQIVQWSYGHQRLRCVLRP